MTDIKKTIDSIVLKTMTMDLTWNWPGGVAYYGVAKAYETTGEEKYLSLLRERIDELIDLGLPTAWSVNACAMGHCLITLYEHTGEQKYWDIVMQKIAYLQNDALRFGDSVLQHTVSSNNDFPEQAWADTLFMAAYFMLRVGAKLSDEALINDALRQYHTTSPSSKTPKTGFGIMGTAIKHTATFPAFTGRVPTRGPHTPCPA